MAARAHGAAPVSIPDTGVVYSQNGTDSGIGIVSQNFESSFDIYDAAAADDFVVKKAKIVEVYNGFNGCKDMDIDDSQEGFVTGALTADGWEFEENVSQPKRYTLEEF
jgi:hypothetical protein